MQKAIIVTDRQGGDKINPLNKYLDDGWTFVSATPMGGGGYGGGSSMSSDAIFKSLVIIQKDAD